MNVLYTTNDAFVGKVATSICSLFENNRKMDQITVYIVGQNITQENCKKLYEMGKNYQREVVITELGEISSYLDFEFDTNGWNPIVLARLLLDYLLPEELDKILYLDGDTVVIDSLEDLWNVDLEGHSLGACIEPTVDFQRRKNLGMEHIPYVNAGVLLVNMNQWRKDKTGQKILEYYKAHNGNLFANDQDAINGALKGNIVFLPPKYNFYNIYWFYPYRVLKKMMKSADYYDAAVYNDSLEHPAIIHYLGEERPWRKGNKHKFRKYYQEYLAKTAWKDEPEEEGWNLYFTCWNIFNCVMHPFPMLRYKIINGLIPLFMSWRKKQLKEKK